MIPRLILLAAVLTLSTSTFATFMTPEIGPVDRIVRNVEQYIEAHPDRADGYYTLGRAHYMALVANAPSVAYYEGREDGLPTLDPPYSRGLVSYTYRRQKAEALVLEASGYEKFDDLPVEKREAFYERVRVETKNLEAQGWAPEPLSATAVIEHASRAAANLRRAIELDPDNGLYHLSLASLFDQFQQMAANIDRKAIPAALWPSKDEVSDHYYEAFELAIANDLQQEHQPIRGLDALVSYEAGKAYLSRTQSDRITTEKAQRQSEVNQALAKLNSLPMGPITPIVFSLEPGATLQSLVADELTVSFDMDGNGVPERWPWVNGSTALLVWDPKGTGQVKSGRQLFGTFTWLMLFENGYRALDALDDSRNGWLEGGELDGLAAWFDRNGNAVSEPGEVVPLRVMGIEAIATQATGQEGEAPMNASGLRMRDGRVLPTWDWVVEAQ